MVLTRSLYFLCFTAVIIAIFWFRTQQQNKRPAQKLPYEVVDDFLTDEQVIKLRTLWEKHFPVIQPAQVDWPIIPSIGEDIDPLPDGRCPSPYLILHEGLHKCITPVRVDLAHHYAFTGGYNGWKEKFSRLLSRSLTFAHHEFFEHDAHEEFRTLYEDETPFYTIGRKMCPETHQYVLPFQISLHLHLPGQNIPPHYDIPYFKGITRRIYPHYLLIAMGESGLFEEYRIPIIQSMTYVHDWNPLNTTQDQHTNENGENFKTSNIGGDIVFYVNGSGYDPVVKMVLPKRSVFIDGTRTVHTSSTYKLSSIPPKFDQNLPQKLVWNKSMQKWQIFINGTATNQYYGWHEIRATVAWRAACFVNEEEANSYDPKMADPDMNLDYILKTLKDDMINKGAITQDKLNNLSKHDLIKLILTMYIRYPKPALSYVSFNYCVLLQLLPNYTWLNYLTSMMCPM